MDTKDAKMFSFVNYFETFEIIIFVIVKDSFQIEKNV